MACFGLQNLATVLSDRGRDGVVEPAPDNSDTPAAHDPKGRVAVGLVQTAAGRRPRYGRTRQSPCPEPALFSQGTDNTAL